MECKDDQPERKVDDEEKLEAYIDPVVDVNGVSSVFSNLNNFIFNLLS